MRARKQNQMHAHVKLSERITINGMILNYIHLIITQQKK